nr:pyridoxamine 5'-phosphate oxidase family protein [Oceanococcus sp. HetDA_MAG_MS8]
MNQAAAEAPYNWVNSLRQAIKKNRREAHNRYVQIATVGSNGQPAVRTLVCRQFDHQQHRLLMVTDQRSQKTEHIRTNPAAEACWYFTRTREQFRLAGTLRLIHAEHHAAQSRLELWATLSDSARAQFHWLSPGEPVSDERHEWESVCLDKPPPNFCALILQIEAVDHLRLQKPQQRWQSQRGVEGDWVYQEVNP